MENSKADDKRILVVEDELEITRVCIRTLVPEGYQVDTAGDGIEAMKDILEIQPNAKIVFISADANVREEAMSKGAVSFGLKPVTIRHMLELVESAVDN